ncbi:hypothetical protein Pcinc_013430 [Petrolisthes cinctipes]|uniref:MCM C-terminal AAA(+) ATPase domain-containing protein n=1 Tax=Petrolisthes cinctipes TaxID=88211 RepID=A0AAE1FZ41_PETCI|nr:hypothetical protein Pcinc_013430 [Petrolisthes cinctipes]
MTPSLHQQYTQLKMMMVTYCRLNMVCVLIRTIRQTVSIQEMPEKSPAGQLPRSVDIVLDNDLVDKCKPGDRVQVVGIYRCLPNKQGAFTSGTFRTILLANNVILMNKEVSPQISTDDNVDVFEMLAKSLAPSIHGHEYIKKALLCMLLGGVEKVLPNGTRLRGVIASLPTMECPETIYQQPTTTLTLQPLCQH